MSTKTELYPIVKAAFDEVVREERLETYPKNITDKVCLKIQNSPLRLDYEHLVANSSIYVVNPQIGKLVSEITGLKSGGKSRKSISILIKSYSELE